MAYMLDPHVALDPPTRSYLVKNKSEGMLKSELCSDWLSSATLWCLQTAILSFLTLCQGSLPEIEGSDFRGVSRGGGPGTLPNVDHSPRILREALFSCVFGKMSGMSQIRKTLQTCRIVGKNDISTNKRVHASSRSFGCRGEQENMNIDFKWDTKDTLWFMCLLWFLLVCLSPFSRCHARSDKLSRLFYSSPTVCPCCLGDWRFWAKRCLNSNSVL